FVMRPFRHVDEDRSVGGGRAWGSECFLQERSSSHEVAFLLGRYAKSLKDGGRNVDEAPSLSHGLWRSTRHMKNHRHPDELLPYFKPMANHAVLTKRFAMIARY